SPVAQIPAELWRSHRNSGTTAPTSGGEIMSAHQDPRNRELCHWMATVACICGLMTFALGQQPEAGAPRRLNLHDAVEMALKHNHVVRIATFHVEEQKHAKEVARSAYLPTIRNDSSFAHVTDTQFIAIPAGGLGVVSGASIPAQQFNINQGDKNFIVSG